LSGQSRFGIGSLAARPPAARATTRRLPSGRVVGGALNRVLREPTDAMLGTEYAFFRVHMNKTLVHTSIIDRLQADLLIARDALKASHEAATHAESKAENKYDTRGLEAAYLADGQRRRLHEIEQALSSYRNFPVRTPDPESIKLGALVVLETAGERRWVFLGPDAAGLQLLVEGAQVLVISPRSPLGQALLGRSAGEEVDVQVGDRRQRYEVVAVY